MDLQAIVYAERLGSLRSILANADAIDVDVPAPEVLERVVRRLQAERHTRRGESFALS